VFGGTGPRLDLLVLRDRLTELSVASHPHYSLTRLKTGPNSSSLTSAQSRYAAF
jgi:hypothetical protein